MIYKLLEAIVGVLQTAFLESDVPDARITVGRLSLAQLDPAPRIGVSFGPLAVNQQMAESPSSTVRPQEKKERIAVDNVHPLGPYILSKTPLENSLTGQVIFKDGLVGERRRLILENKDFTLNYATRTLAFTTDISGADVLSLQYSFPGIFTIREFKQGLIVEIIEASAWNLERLSAITTAVLLTNHDAFLEQFNKTNRTEHSSGNYLSAHTIREITLLNVTPSYFTEPPIFLMRLQCEVAGDIKAIKEIGDGFDLIKKIDIRGDI